jgi:hypothetical protein
MFKREHMPWLVLGAVLAGALVVAGTTWVLKDNAEGGGKIVNIRTSNDFNRIGSRTRHVALTVRINNDIREVVERAGELQTLSVVGGVLEGQHLDLLSSSTIRDLGLYDVEITTDWLAELIATMSELRSLTVDARYSPITGGLRLPEGRVSVKRILIYIAREDVDQDSVEAFRATNPDCQVILKYRVS